MTIFQHDKGPTIPERIARLHRVMADTYSARAMVIHRDEQERVEVVRLDAESKRLNDKADSLSGKLAICLFAKKLFGKCPIFGKQTTTGSPFKD